MKDEIEVMLSFAMGLLEVWFDIQYIILQLTINSAGRAVK